MQVSFFSGLDLGQVEAADFIQDPGISIASLLDLAGPKVKVIIQRVEPRDYIDIHAFLTKGGIPLARMLAAASLIFGPQFNYLLTLKAIAYHDDPALAALSDDVKRDLVKAVQATDPEKLPALNPIRTWQATA